MSLAEKVVAKFRQAVEESEGERQKARTTPFESLYDLKRYMYEGPGVHEGWRKGPGRIPENDEYMKRFGGVWYALSIGKSHWSTDVFIFPTTSPKGPGVPDWKDKDAWDEINKKLRIFIPIKGLTIGDIEHKIEEMVKEFKAVSGGRNKKDISKWRFQTRDRTDEDPYGKLHEGPAAVAAWRKEVEDLLQDVIDSSGKHGHDWDTAGLVGNILENYGREMEGPSRSDMSRFIRTILEGMFKRNKIDKLDFGRGELRWRSLSFVAKPKPGW